MSKKHFEALAAALKEKQPYIPQSGDGLTMQELARRASAFSQWTKDAQSVADVCARFNPNFDRERFLKACGVEG